METKTGYKAVKSMDLGRYNAAKCSNCGRGLRFAFLLRSENGLLTVLGGECVSKYQPETGRRFSADFITACIKAEDSQSPVARATLEDGFLVPASCYNEYPVTHVGERMLFSLMPSVKPLPFHCRAKKDVVGYWARCHGADCHLCEDLKVSPIVGSLYAACVWKLNRNGTQALPSNFPYGCVSFRALGLRDVDIATMKSLREDFWAYDWRITYQKQSYSVRPCGASGLLTAGDYIVKLSTIHAPGGVWGEQIMRSTKPEVINLDGLENLE